MSMDELNRIEQMVRYLVDVFGYDERIAYEVAISELAYDMEV